MRICTYNIHGGQDAERRPSLAILAATLTEIAPDVCLLQEVDRFLPRSRFQDQAAFLADALGAEFHFYGRLRVGRAAFGNAILTRLPVQSVMRLALPGGGEPRCAVGVALGEGLNIWNTHLGLRDAWRAEQLDALARDLGNTTLLVVGGDFNADIMEPPVERFLERTGLEPLSGDEPTFPCPGPRRRIDFLLGRGVTPSASGTLAAPGSDHCLVWIDVSPVAAAVNPPPPPGAVPQG